MSRRQIVSHPRTGSTELLIATNGVVTVVCTWYNARRIKKAVATVSVSNKVVALTTCYYAGKKDWEKQPNMKETAGRLKVMLHSS